MTTRRRSEWRGWMQTRAGAPLGLLTSLAAVAAIVVIAAVVAAPSPTASPRIQSRVVASGPTGDAIEARATGDDQALGAAPDGTGTTGAPSPSSTGPDDRDRAETTAPNGPSTASTDPTSTADPTSTSGTTETSGGGSTTAPGTSTSGATSTAPGGDGTTSTAPGDGNDDTTTTETTAPTTTGTDPTTVDGVDRFDTLAPGAALPTGAQCAARVRPVDENVPENAPYNATTGGPVTGTYLSIDESIAANDYETRIDGDFTGSTDEIIQWASCKWGFDEDLVRAQAYVESSWYAGKLGDCGEVTVPETGGCSSVGLIQVRSAESGFTHHPGVYPAAWNSTALNLDYALAVMRLCFEGGETWLAQAGDYAPGDHGNCMGRWFSGSWADAGSLAYQAEVQRVLAERPWEGPWVGCPDWQSSNHCGR